MTANNMIFIEHDDPLSREDVDARISEMNPELCEMLQGLGIKKSNARAFDNMAQTELYCKR